MKSAILLQIEAVVKLHSNRTEYDSIISRLDFDTTVLAGPDRTGECGTANDEFTFTSPSTTIPGVASLCGTLTGQHRKKIF